MAIDKTQLTEDLRQVFITRGYDGATLAHLSASTGLSKASLYHHFPGGKP
ncbi:MAG: TetR/AcrR family transcriptional repressor of lmrAB and yxaGH operons, partial [Candidatus Azotimanducaceae bacterium]